jgi:16S rRNA (cytosine967-C5)-methyltransferase
MRSEARFSAAIELLDVAVEEIINGGAALDVVSHRYFNERRYAGSSDRRAIKNQVFGVMRDLELVIWALREADAEITGRNIFLCLSAWSGAEELEVYGAGRYGPAAITPDERNFLWTLPEKADAPEWARTNCPQFVEKSLRSRFGARFREEMEALNKRAPLNIRVNLMTARTEQIESMFTKAEMTFRHSRWLPECLKSGPINLTQSSAFKNGRFEIQDESSQIGARLVNAKPGQHVLDLCAGAGGKSLAVSVSMKGKGFLYACDIYADKLKETARRAKRALAKNIETLCLPSESDPKRASYLKHFADRMDRIILDVPCSGSGTWRRSPDLRIRLNEDSLHQVLAEQKALLDESVAMLKAGGRLVYMTCSILPQENEDQVMAFLAHHKGIRLLDYKKVWRELGLEADAPISRSTMDECLQLTPASHGCDGFFVAIFERSS